MHVYKGSTSTNRSYLWLKSINKSPFMSVTDLLDIPELWPNIVRILRPHFYLSIHPCFCFISVNGNSKIVSVKNITPDEISWYVNLLCSSSGVKVEKLQKMWHTINPSIQGNWTPFLNK